VTSLGGRLGGRGRRGAPIGRRRWLGKSFLLGHRPDGLDGTRRLIAVTPIGEQGGAEAVLVRLLAAAVAAGWEVQCCCPRGEVAQQLRDAGVRVRRIPPALAGTGTLRFVVLGLRLLGVAAVVAASGRADVVLSNGLTTLLPLRLLRTVGLLTPPTVVAWLAHDVVVHRNRQQYLRAGAPALDVAAVVSNAVAGPLRAQGIKCVLLRNGAPWPLEPAAPADWPPWVIGCNAALTEWKGQRVLLDAVAGMRERRVVVELLGRTFGGDRAYRAALEARAGESDLAGRVHFLGWSSEPLMVMRRWHVAVSASTSPEASALGVLEAMALGVPQVCTAHGGPSEILGEAGLLVAPGDPMTMAAALDALLADPVLWARCHTAGRRVVAAGMTVDAQDRGFVALLEAWRDGNLEPAGQAS